MMVRITKPDGGILDQEVSMEQPVEKWTHSELKAFTEKMRALVQADTSEWQWEREEPTDLGAVIVGRASGWTLRSEPLKLRASLFDDPSPGDGRTRWQG